jgi:uncharacterized membrane protein YqjE
MAEVRGPVGPQEPVAENLRDMSEAIGRLVKEHVELATVELRSSAKKAAFDVSLTSAGAGMLLLGWVLCMFAAGYGLGRIIGDGFAFLIIGGAHGLLGAALAGVFGNRLRTQDKLEPVQTEEEIGRDRRFVHRLGLIVRARPRVPA